MKFLGSLKEFRVRANAHGLGQLFHRRSCREQNVPSEEKIKRNLDIPLFNLFFRILSSFSCRHSLSPARLVCPLPWYLKVLKVSTDVISEITLEPAHLGNFSNVPLRVKNKGGKNIIGSVALGQMITE